VFGFVCVPVLYWISAQFNIGSADSGIKTSLSNLHGVFLVLDSLLQELNVLLHVEDLLQYLDGS